MLGIDMEFRKGVLFVRLSGVLNKNTVSKLDDEVTDLVMDNGIRNLVFNISELESIDMKGINSLLHNYELCNRNKGQSLLCGLKNNLVRHRIENTSILKYMYETSDELSAINIIDLS